MAINPSTQPWSSPILTWSSNFPQTINSSLLNLPEIVHLAPKEPKRSIVGSQARYLSGENQNFPYQISSANPERQRKNHWTSSSYLPSVTSPLNSRLLRIIKGWIPVPSARSLWLSTLVWVQRRRRRVWRRIVGRWWGWRVQGVMQGIDLVPIRMG